MNSHEQFSNPEDNNEPIEADVLNEEPIISEPRYPEVGGYDAAELRRAIEEAQEK